MAHDLAEVLCFQSCIQVERVLPSAEEASCIFPFRMKLEIFGSLAWKTKGERKKQTLEEASGPASASAPKHKRLGLMASKAVMWQAPPERRTIHVIFADPILVAMECVSVSSSSDLKQDVRSRVRSVKIQKLYETFVVSHQ